MLVMDRRLQRLFGRRLRDLRKRRGFTQESFAEATNRSVKTISNIERGQGGASLDTLEAFAKRLGVDIKDLFEGVSLRRHGDPHRPQLEARIVDIIHELDRERLEIAGAQVEALLKRKTT